MMKLSGTVRRRAIDGDAGQNEADSPVGSDRILSIPPASGQDSVRPFGYLTAVTRSSGT
jgi:hypothetical protein